MKRLLFISSLNAAIVLLSFSCTDHQLPEEDQWRVKTITQVKPNEHEVKVVSMFSYNSDAKISSISAYHTPDSSSFPTERSIYQYDHDGRLAQVNRTLNLSQSERYIYEYDLYGKLASIQYTADPLDFYNLTFFYDNAGVLTASKRSFNFASAIIFEQLNDYVFNHHNLSRSITATNISIKGWQSNSTVTQDYIYDDHPNPFFGTYLIPAPGTIAYPTNSGNFNYYTFYGGVDNIFHLNKDNLISSNIKGSWQTTYSYTYHESGMPASRKTLSASSPGIPTELQETLFYEYERY